MALRIRPFEQRDIEPLYGLWCTQARLIPHQPGVRLDQFVEHLTTSRLYQNSGEFNPKAEIAVVAVRNGRPVAFAVGGQYVKEGDAMTKAGEAHIRMVLADPGYRTWRRASLYSHQLVYGIRNLSG